MHPTDVKRLQLDDFFRSLPMDRGVPAVRVAQVMTQRPIACGPQTTAYELVQMFHARQFRHLLVTDDGRLVGVVSDRDVLRCFGTQGAPTREQLEAVTAEKLMSSDVITIEPEVLLGEAVSVMLAHGINCLPVVERGRLAGIITSTDLYLVLERLLSKAADAVEMPA